MTSLNLSGLTNLDELMCGNNQLTSLNISGCKALSQLMCFGNKLKKLDISNCMGLVKCYSKGKHTTINGVQNMSSRKAGIITL